jgi:hypothetical protein
MSFARAKGVFLMANRLPTNAHFQLRLVKRFDGRRIVTFGNLAKPKEGEAKDQTLDLFANERSALQYARNYCSRGERRKGPLPGEFLGVVIVQHESDPSKWKSIAPGSPLRGAVLANRPKRAKDTTVWRFYVDPDGKAYAVNPKTHEIDGPIS